MALHTKPRWDKYDAYVGNFRAPLGANVASDHFNKVVAVGLDSNGAVVIGGGQTGVVGLMIVAVGQDIHGNLLDGGINTQAGDIQDIGVHGEITNFVGWDVTAKTETPSVAGTKWYAKADGSLTHTAAAGQVLVGYTVEKDRLIVHVDPATAVA